MSSATPTPWWDRHFGDVPSLCRFRWGSDFRGQLEAALNDPQAAGKKPIPLSPRRACGKNFLALNKFR